MKMLWRIVFLLLMCPTLADASERAFVSHTNYVVDPSFSHTIDNMPRIQSQGTVGNCFACAAATVAQKFACDTDEGIIAKGWRCDQIPADRMISQLAMIAWADVNDRTVGAQLAGLPSNHTNLRLYDTVTDYSSGSNALKNASDLFDFIPESCYPFERLLAIYKSDETGTGPIFEPVYYKHQAMYLKNRSARIDSVPCEECRRELSEDINMDVSVETFKFALTKKTYGEFLYSVFFRKCKRAAFSTAPKFVQFPAGQLEKYPKEKVFEKLVEVVGKNHPVLISGLCLKFDADTKKCSNSHAVVVSGYRRICPTSDLTNNSCKTQLKVHNCWGQNWQAKQDDGWVNSDTFIASIDEGSDAIPVASLSWLERLGKRNEPK